jgi:uracil-DNA glycosylase family protein
MAIKTSAAPFVPERLNLKALREAADLCQGCELYKNATQTVFGRGPRMAAVMMVGEVPGDEEDRQGRPFVGPAGGLLRGVAEEAGLFLDDIYLTNAVKHFRWEQKGRYRLHRKPSWSQVKACRPWLEAEITVIEPQVIVCLGATAAQSLLGTDFRLTQQRGRFVKNDWAPKLLATYHPSAILRAPDSEDRERKREEFLKDLRKVAAAVSDH